MTTAPPSATSTPGQTEPAPRSTDLLGTELTPTEAQVLSAYDTLRALAAADDLAPCAAAGVRAALAPLAVVVTDLGLRYEHLLDDHV